MGLVVRRFDRIRAECKAHFLLIHHCGKNAAAGSRGWSGIRADTFAGKCAEITKQRDLPTKGDRIGFKLHVVMLGLTKWKTPATSCVVMPADAPKKHSGKRTSEVSGAIFEMLLTKGEDMKKVELVKHFADRYDKSTIYRELKKLVESRRVKDVLGVVSIVSEVIDGGVEGAN